MKTLERINPGETLRLPNQSTSLPLNLGRQNLMVGLTREVGNDQAVLLRGLIDEQFCVPLTKRSIAFILSTTDVATLPHLRHVILINGIA